MTLYLFHVEKRKLYKPGCQKNLAAAVLQFDQRVCAGRKNDTKHGEVNGDNISDAVMVDKSNCLWLEWKVIVFDRTHPLRLSGGQRMHGELLLDYRRSERSLGAPQKPDWRET